MHHLRHADAFKTSVKNSIPGEDNVWIIAEEYMLSDFESVFDSIIFDLDICVAILPKSKVK